MNTQRSRFRILVPLVLLMIISIVVLALYSDKIQSSASTTNKTDTPASATPTSTNQSDASGTLDHPANTNNTKENLPQNQQEKQTEPSQIGSGRLDLPNNDSISFLKSLMAFTFVLGLIFLAAYFYKKVMGIKSTGSRTNRVPIHMIGHLPLGEKKFLTIIEIQGKHYFIGITPSTINLLSKIQLDLPPETVMDDGDSDFENIFRKARALLQKNKK